MPLSKPAPSDRTALVSRRLSMRSNRRLAIPDYTDEDEVGISEDLMSRTSSDRAETIVSDSGETSAALADRMRSLDEFATRHQTPEETQILVQQLEKSQDVPFTRTYRLGQCIPEFEGSAHSPHVGLVILRGADLPEVNRLEQQGMVSQVPEQRTNLYRVNVAGSLLRTTSVTGDLNLITEDVTPSVAALAHRRMQQTYPHPKIFYGFSKSTVVIDSENVEIVHEFEKAKKTLDIAATLIEVDTNALWTLMTDYKQIIRHAGPLMTPDDTRQLLDQMIEAARQFCLLSPILFRQSTRAKIIASNDTRYGQDSDETFKTFTTSSGIKEIIMMSASYYSALASLSRYKLPLR